MSTYETKDGRGALFQNDRKESESQPDLKGNIKVAGIEYWISAWRSESPKGVKYWSLAVNPKQEKPAESAVDKDLNDDLSKLPF